MKQRKKLTPAQLRIYRRGLARGKVLAADALLRQRRAAARKAAETRKRRPKKKKPIPREEGLIVGEVVLYDAPDVEGVPILSGLSFAEFVEASAWEAKVELWIEGQMVADGTIDIPAEWDNEAAAKLIRREVRSWYEGQISEHPSWRESPAATLIRLSLRRT